MNGLKQVVLIAFKNTKQATSALMPMEKEPIFNIDA
jgi:hypothetical protein